MAKHKVILYISYLVCLTSVVLFLMSLSQNIGGKIKVSMYLLPLLSVIITVLLSLLIERPHMLNYPVEITESNKLNLYRKARILLSVISLFIASIFLILIMKTTSIIKIHWSFEFIVFYFLFFSIVPFVVIALFRKDA
jgi:hypothetical protein